MVYEFDSVRCALVRVTDSVVSAVTTKKRDLYVTGIRSDSVQNGPKNDLGISTRSAVRPGKTSYSNFILFLTLCDEMTLKTKA